MISANARLRSNLCSSTRDEEPLVDAWVNWSRGNVLVLWDGRKLVWVDTAWRLLDGKVGTVELSVQGL